MFTYNCKRCNYPLTDNTSILDFGCGDGSFVRDLVISGYDAYGVDIYSRLNESARPYAHRFSTIEIPQSTGDWYNLPSWDDYRLPYPDNSFDVVISRSVLEHIFNLEVALKEIARVLKKDGISMHTFPYKYCLVECHTMVPLGSLFPCYPYFYLWAALGHRAPHRKGFSAKKTALENYIYMKNNVRYLSAGAMTAVARRYFSSVRFDFFASNIISRLYQHLFRASIMLVLSNKPAAPGRAGKAGIPEKYL
jgi:SAM-dependent methyltransferase